MVCEYNWISDWTQRNPYAHEWQEAQDKRVCIIREEDLVAWITTGRRP